MFFYSDVKSGGLGAAVWRMNASTVYLKHFENLMFLEFVSRNPVTTFSEKRQAEKEIEICRKKLVWWKRHPLFDEKIVESGTTKIKKDWKDAA